MTTRQPAPAPLRVVHVVGAASVQSGSFERHLQAVARHALGRGLALELVYPAALPSGQHADALKELGVAVHVVPTSSRAHIRCAAQLAPLIRRADIVHGHFAPACDVAAGLAALHRRPVLLTRHYLAPNGARSGHGVLTRIEGRLAARHVAVSQPVADSLVSLGVSPDRISVLPLGVDRARFNCPTAAQRSAARAVLGLDEGTKIVVSTSHHRPGKGIDVLVEAASLAGDWTVLAAGDGPQRAELEELTARTEARVRFLGRIDDVRTLLHAADAFCLPTVDYPEGLPMAVLEALATGLPVVATPVPGIMPVLTAAGGAARVVEAANTAALAEGLAGMLSVPRPSDEARGATAPFDLDLAAAALVDLYEEISASGATRAAA